ncbi:MAG: hypothetical protein ABIK90_07350 [candidate division WOR-3 bacterium]
MGESSSENQEPILQLAVETFYPTFQRATNAEKAWDDLLCWVSGEENNFSFRFYIPLPTQEADGKTIISLLPWANIPNLDRLIPPDEIDQELDSVFYQHNEENRFPAIIDKLSQLLDEGKIAFFTLTAPKMVDNNPPLYVTQIVYGTIVNQKLIIRRVATPPLEFQVTGTSQPITRSLRTPYSLIVGSPEISQLPPPPSLLTRRELLQRVTRIFGS